VTRENTGGGASSLAEKVVVESGDDEMKKPTEKVIIQPEVYRGKVFELSLSQLFAISGNQIPQFWTLIFQILNKPLFLCEEGMS
jgi:hypothetical protein